MSKEVRRGYAPEDDRLFRDKNYDCLKQAAIEYKYLLDHGYPVKPASTFVGNHYMFSERQRLAIVRSVSPEASLKQRQASLIRELPADCSLNLDGFNTIITLEVALSGSPILHCMDQCYRDLAGLRGTYRIIDKTPIALHLLFDWLTISQAAKITIYLDAPVSNSGRLKTLIQEIAADYPIVTEVVVTNDVDRILSNSSFVITSDAIILNQCQSWVNAMDNLIHKIPDTWILSIGS